MLRTTSNPRNSVYFLRKRLRRDFRLSLVLYCRKLEVFGSLDYCEIVPGHRSYKGNKNWLGRVHMLAVKITTYQRHKRYDG